MTRRAAVEDVPALVQMGRDFLAATAYQQHLATNVDQLEAFARGVLANPQAGAFVHESDGKVVGMIGLLVAPHPMSGQTMAYELCWWVDPKRRGGGLGLYRAAAAWAKTQGAIAIQMIAPTREVERMYELLGFTRVETAYQRSL